MSWADNTFTGKRGDIRRTSSTTDKKNRMYKGDLQMSG